MAGTNHYLRQEQRIQRYKELSAKFAAQSDQTLDQAHRMADVIPFGQPILVGHYSEKRDRNYRDRISKKYDQALELHDKAKFYARKAEAAENGREAISSDAPDALELLREKLETLKASHAIMVSANKIARSKKLSQEQKIAELVNLGLSEGEAREKITPDGMYGRLGYPQYRLTNSSANIRNVEKRIEELERRQKDVSTETEIGNITITDSVEENRIMIFFPGVPDEGIRDMLKHEGFRWSPSNQAWQAYRSAKWKIPGIIKRLTAMPAYVTPVTNYRQPRDYFNLYLTGYYFNTCLWCEASKEEIINLFYDGIREKPADWIAPEMITYQRCEA